MEYERLGILLRQTALLYHSWEVVTDEMNEMRWEER